MKKCLALALAIVLAMSLWIVPSASAANDQIVISISHSYTELDQVSVELNTAAQNIYDRTNGAVKVNLYPNNTFGNLVDGVEAVAANSPLMLMAAFSQWEDLCYDASALQCGFVFDTGEEFLKVMDTDLFAKIVEEMDAVNIHPLNCSFVGGMRHVIGKKPYTTPADMKGLKLRVTRHLFGFALRTLARLFGFGLARHLVVLCHRVPSYGVIPLSAPVGTLKVITRKSSLPSHPTTGSAISLDFTRNTSLSCAVRNAETDSRNCARINSRSDFLDTAIGSTPFHIFYSNYSKNLRICQGDLRSILYTLSWR